MNEHKQKNSNKDWSQKEIEFLKENLEILTLPELSEQLGRSEYGIIRKGEKLGFKPKGAFNKQSKVKPRLWTQEEIVFLRENYKNIPTAQLSKILNRTIGSINDKKNKLGLLAGRQTYDYLSEFQNKTPQLAYFLGFTFADGHLTNNPKYSTQRIMIGVTKNDGIYLDKILAEISQRWNKRFIKSQENTKETVQYEIHDNPVVQFLREDLGLEHKNEFFSHKIFDFLPENLHRYFWRGYCDGDGSINNSGGGLSVNFCGPENMDWSKLQEFISSLECKSTVRKNNNLNSGRKIIGSWSHLTISSPHGCAKFVHNVYGSISRDNIGFTRKWIKYVEYMENRAVSPYKHREVSNQELLSGKSFNWSEQEIAFLRDNTSLTLSELAQKLERTELGVLSKSKRLGFKLKTQNSVL